MSYADSLQKLYPEPEVSLVLPTSLVNSELAVYFVADEDKILEMRAIQFYDAVTHGMRIRKYAVPRVNTWFALVDDTLLVERCSPIYEHIQQSTNITMTMQCANTLLGDSRDEYNVSFPNSVSDMFPRALGVSPQDMVAYTLSMMACHTALPQKPKLFQEFGFAKSLVPINQVQKYTRFMDWDITVRNTRLCVKRDDEIIINIELVVFAGFTCHGDEEAGTLDIVTKTEDGTATLYRLKADTREIEHTEHFKTSDVVFTEFGLAFTRYSFRGDGLLYLPDGEKQELKLGHLGVFKHTLGILAGGTK